MQLDDVAVVWLGLGAVEAFDVGVGDLDDRHALVVAQRVQPLDVLAPEVEDVDVAIAGAKMMKTGIRQRAIGTSTRPGTLYATTRPQEWAFTNHFACVNGRCSAQPFVAWEVVMLQLKLEDAAAERPDTRRDLMKKIGRAALAVPPAVTLIMAATSRPARAQPPYGLPPTPPRP